VCEEAEGLASLASDFSGVLLPALPAAAQGRARGNLLLLLHLQAAARFGASVRATERELLTRALGRDEGEPLRALDERMRRAPAAEDERWLRCFAELGARRLALWPYLAGVAAKKLARLA
jgi:hypothetical protein